MKSPLLLLLTLILVVSGPAAPLLAAEEKGDTPTEMANYYFVLLTRGSKWTPEHNAETERIQAAHLANIGRFRDSGKLALAGPFTDNGNWRGLFILKASSAEEARSLVETDPAAQAGRLGFEIHPWMTKKGMLPDS